MSFLPETLCLHRVARAHYFSLPRAPHCQVTYIWINPSGTRPKAKTRTLDREPQSVQDVPRWNATYTFDKVVHEVILAPVQMFRDPFMLDPNKLVLCDVWMQNGMPVRNTKAECMEAMEAVKDQKPWFGFEQEYMLQTLDGKIFEWNGFDALSGDNKYYSASGQVGLNKVFGRDVSLSHYNTCLYAGIKITGMTGEAMPAQWEFQVGPCEGLELGDHTWMARYILHRVCEDFGVMASLHPKPLPYERWGNGGHMNFSTESMRAEGGINQQRLSGGGLAYSNFHTFTWGIADRLCSVRIPGLVSQAGKGYLEDRRPAADCDPYLVCKALVQTCILPPSVEEQGSQCTCILPPGVEELEEQGSQ